MKGLNNLLKNSRGIPMWIWPKRGTSYQLFVIRQIIEKCCNHDIDLNILFVEFRQAFGSVRRAKLYKDKRDMGIPLKLTKLAMGHTKPKFKFEITLSKSFTFNKVVKQGDGFSATLFITAQHYAIKAVDHRGTILNKTSQMCAWLSFTRS